MQQVLCVWCARVCYFCMQRHPILQNIIKNMKTIEVYVCTWHKQQSQITNLNFASKCFTSPSTTTKIDLCFYGQADSDNNNNSTASYTRYHVLCIDSY